MKNTVNKSIWIILPIVLLFLFSYAFAQQKQIESRDAAFYINRGFSYLDSKQYDQAISDFTKALEINPMLANVHFVRGTAYYYKGQYDQALSDYNKAIELNPRLADAYKGRGAIYIKKEQYDRAISDYNKVLELNPSDYEAHNNLSWILATSKTVGLRNGKKALELALKACELSNWENPSFFDTLAAAYARVGDFNNAVKWQVKALESPKLNKNPEAQQRLKFYKERKPWPAD